MKFFSEAHLSYCTNIHPAESWEETLAVLRSDVLEVRDGLRGAGRLEEGRAFGIGLRLSDQASQQLWGDQEALRVFSQWLKQEHAYVFTVNAFPFGGFHGVRVKEKVYQPDWSHASRLEYTKRCFDILAALEQGATKELSVSTLPLSFKEFALDEAAIDQAMVHLLDCALYVEGLSVRTGKDFHLGMEPEPLGFFETSQETIDFFEKLWKRFPDPEHQEVLKKRIGVNYDCCHLAVEYESAQDALGALLDAGVRLSKVHLSSALSLVPSDKHLESLRAFEDEVYLHQVVVKREGQPLERWRDLDAAFEKYQQAQRSERGDLWRVHYHVPVHGDLDLGFEDTKDHVREALHFLKQKGMPCQHFELETYTWGVLPEALQSGRVSEQLVREYGWVLDLED